MNKNTFNGYWNIFIFSFIIRLIASILTTLTDLNPESRYDAGNFAAAGESISQGLLQLQLISPGPTVTYDRWGLFLSAYWFFPGPSAFYGRVGNALLSTFAICNVYIIARYYHSHRAGVIAVTPLIFYPSIIAVHSTLLREAIVLFGITTAVRLVVIPSKTRYRWLSYGVALVVLYTAHIHRPDNYIIYIAAIGTGLFIYVIEKGYLSKRGLGLAAGLSPVLVVALWSFVQSGVAYLSRTRDVRGGGRTDYLVHVIPQTLSELAAFSWIGAAYFLYAPFPWMVGTVPDLLVSMEGLVTMGFTIAAFWGVRSFAQQNKPATAALVVGLLLAVVFYGVGTINFGTGMRHRQMFLWIIFLFGGIGIAEHVQFRGLPERIQFKTSG